MAGHRVIPIAPAHSPIRERKREAPKGRRPTDQALAEVRQLLGDAPRRRDLLIEHLHRIQDRFGCLSAAHLVALAPEMKLAMAEVYEVATFYHHFDVVKEGETPPPAITVRVCDGAVLRDGRRAAAAASSCRRCSARDVRVLAAPCVGRCEQAPAAVVGQNPVAARDAREGRRRAVAAKRAARARARSATSTTPPIARDGGYALLRDCVGGERDVEDVIADDGGLRPARPRRRGLPGRPQVEASCAPSRRRA